MKTSITFAFLLLLAAESHVQKVNGLVVGCEGLNGRTPLITAVKNNDLNCVRRLLNSGVDANYQENRGGWTALIYAASFGYVEVAELLLTKADAKVTNEGKNSPLMLAATYGKDKMVELLLPFSNVKAKSRKGQTALDMAIEIFNRPQACCKKEYKKVIDRIRQFKIASEGWLTFVHT